MFFVILEKEVNVPHASWGEILGSDELRWGQYNGTSWSVETITCMGGSEMKKTNTQSISLLILILSVIQLVPGTAVPATDVFPDLLMLSEGLLASNVAVVEVGRPTYSTPEGFVLVPAGRFTMGSPEDEMCRYNGAEPQHQVTLTRSFYMKQTEVTQAEWMAIFGTNPSNFTGDPQRPVECVTWFDCVIFCNRVSVAQDLKPAYYLDSDLAIMFDGTPPVTSGTVYWDHTAEGYRLPTEAEWEYACRAGTMTAYNSGTQNTSCTDDPNLDPLAWYFNTASRKTHPVGQKQGNAWNLFDMHGNVAEWCWDWFNHSYPSYPVTDPTGWADPGLKAYRGGDWGDAALYCRSARRDGDIPFLHGNCLGFRPVRFAPDQDADVLLDLRMPGSIYGPGDVFWLTLDIENNGPSLPEAQLYLLLDIGTGDYWCYPNWEQYPPDLDWVDINLPVEFAGTLQVIPEFTWPPAGEFWGARFWVAVLDEDVLVSNVEMVEFGWWMGSVPEGFVLVPDGSFTMGSPDVELCQDFDENQYQVTLTRSFFIQKTEVTQEQWMAVFGTNPSRHAGCDQCPVELVTWYDCVIYCNSLSVAQGLRPAYYCDKSFTIMFDGVPRVTDGPVYWDRNAEGYRLPTEAEWEYTCRAGTETAYNSGAQNTSCANDPNLDPLAWYYHNSKEDFFPESHPVGLKQANAWDIYDMHGNVWEWCWDNFGAYPSYPVTNPTGPADELGLGCPVIRGGGWNYEAACCRAANRADRGPSAFSDGLGFRPVRFAP